LMRTIKTYFKRAPFNNAFTRHLSVLLSIISKVRAGLVAGSE